MISKMLWWDSMSIRLLKGSCPCKVPIQSISFWMQHCWAHWNNTSLIQELHQPLQLNIITVFQVTKERARTRTDQDPDTTAVFTAGFRSLPPAKAGFHTPFFCYREKRWKTTMGFQETHARKSAVIHLTHNSSEYLRNTSAGLCATV